MKPRAFILAVLLGGAAFGPAGAQTESSQLSPERLELMEQRGYFTPEFKAAVHDLIDTREAVAQARLDERKLRGSLPDLQKESSDADAQVASLEKELDRYAHPEDPDFDALQKAMKDPAAKPEEQLILAQAFVWSYPTDPHQAEAVQDLQRIQKQLATQQKAINDTEAARAAAHAKLIQRAHARALSFAEWKVFLQNMSQEDLVTYLGRPQGEGVDSWTYTGALTTDPITKQKVGLEIFFNGTRVESIAEVPR